MTQQTSIDKKDSFGITYQSLELMNSIKGLKLTDKKSRPFLLAGIIGGLLAIIFKDANLGFVVLAASFIYLGILSSDRNKKLWVQFAIDNGWSAGPARSAELYVPSSLANIGHSRTISDVITGTFGGHDFRLFTYGYTVGSGKSSTTYRFTLMQLVLKKQLPSFIIDSLRVKGAKNISDGYSKVSLEGNFDDTFNLYVPNGASTDVLSVIAPDVMQTLITSNTMQDVECGSGYAWFIQGGDTMALSQLPRLFTAVDPLANEFAHRAKTYQATNQSAHVAALASTDTIKITRSGRELSFTELKNNTVTKVLSIILITFIALIFVVTLV